MRSQKIICFALACCLVCGIAGKAEDSQRGHLSAWISYWSQPQDLEEAKGLRSALSKLVYFAAYFDETNTPFVPQPLNGMYDLTENALPGMAPARYLSIVNDKVDEEGNVSMKDTALLWDLLGDPECARAHAKELISLAQDYAYEGLEIDYEAMGSDRALWENFAAFLQILWVHAQEAGMPLRVLFEPSAPIEKLQWPEGPEYVMMCYNLYGPHSGPGAKATVLFIQQMAAKMSAMFRPFSLAIATGGNEWVNGQYFDKLSCADAQEKAAEAGVVPSRDATSQCLFFRYRDAQGAEREVWYADGETLACWRRAALESGATEVSLWLLGGNGSLQELIGEPSGL